MSSIPHAAAGRRAAESRVLTVPNAVSLARLACVPVFLWLLFGRDDRAAAAFLLGGLGATDWVDGYIARRFGQVSTVGKVLDPVADRVLLATGVIAILVDGSVPVWVAVVTIAREVGVSLGMLVLAAMGARRIDVQWVGKAGTLALMVAFPLFLASHSDLGWADVAGVLAWTFVLPGIVLSWWAAAGYARVARVALAEGRVGPHAQGADSGVRPPGSRSSDR